MRTTVEMRWPGVALGAAAVLLASCSGEKAPPARAAPETSPAPAPAIAQGLSPAGPARPPGAEAIDAALASVRAFNAKALTDLTGIARAQTRIRDQADRALDAAQRGDGARVTAAQSDAEAAHRALVDGLSAFRTAAAEQQGAVTAALALCGAPTSPPAPGAAVQPVTPAPPPVTTPLPGAPATAAPVGSGVYEGCLPLAAEQGLFTQNVDAVTARHEAAEAAYRQDRPKLEEAAATVALSKLGPL